MSSDETALRERPLIALVDRAYRALHSDMIKEAHNRGHGMLQPAHHAVFSTLSSSGDRAIDMAARAGITRQSMGEIVRDMVALGLLEMRTDPADRRAKLVTYTQAGRDIAQSGFRYIMELEKSFTDEFGEKEYALVRHALDRMVALLARPHSNVV